MLWQHADSCELLFEHIVLVAEKWFPKSNRAYHQEHNFSLSFWTFKALIRQGSIARVGAAIRLICRLSVFLTSAAASKSAPAAADEGWTRSLHWTNIKKRNSHLLNFREE